MASGIELQGVDQMLSQLRSKLQAGADRIERAGLKAAGELMAQAQREKVIVSDRETLHMRDNIRASNVRRGDGMKYVLVGPGKETGWRAHFLEYGTKNTPAKPFIYPAFHENKDQALQLLAQSLKEGISE